MTFRNLIGYIIFYLDNIAIGVIFKLDINMAVIIPEASL